MTHAGYIPVRDQAGPAEQKNNEHQALAISKKKKTKQDASLRYHLEENVCGKIESGEVAGGLPTRFSGEEKTPTPFGSTLQSNI